MNKEIYVVKEVEGKDGLTVGSRVLTPGKKFSKDQWPYGDEALKEAMKNGRCELIEEKKPEVKKPANVKPKQTTDISGDDEVDLSQMSKKERKAYLAKKKAEGIQ